MDETQAPWEGNSRTTICDIDLFLRVSFLTPKGRPTFFFQINTVLSPRGIPMVIAERVKVSFSHSLVLQKGRWRPRERGGLSTGRNETRARDSSPSIQCRLLSRAWA